MANVPITPGTGAVSVAAETVSGLSYQQIEVVGKGGGSVMSVNPDGSHNVSVIGALQASVAGAVQVAGASPASIAAVQRLDVQVIGSTLGLVTHAVLHGLTSAGGGGYVDVKVDPSGALVTTASSVVSYQAPGSVMAVSFSAAANQSVSGAVTAPAGSVMTVAALAGSVTGVRTDNASVITVMQNSSIVAVPVGSVITIFGQTPSVVGTYAEDAAHTSGDKGILSLSVRNDTLASVTSADGDYGAIALGPSGEVVTANSPLTKWIQGTADFRGNAGASIQVLAAQGTSIFTYVTAVQLANMGSASVLVTLTGGLGSVLGYTIAPAGGGSNILYPNALKTGANSGFSASISGVASVLLSAQGFISKS